MVAHSATEIAISAHLFYFSIQFTEFVRYFRDMIFSCAFEFCYLVNLLRLWIAETRFKANRPSVSRMRNDKFFTQKKQQQQQKQNTL